MKKILSIRILMTVAMLFVTVMVKAGGPFEEYSDRTGIVRKYFSQSMLHTMGEIRIATDNFVIDASELKVVDVIESSEEKLVPKLKSEVKKIADSQKLEVLWSNSNKDWGNESVLYGKYDKKNECFSILMYLEVRMGWQSKCVYVEGEIETMYPEY